MLSYQHIYHAGCRADIHKHAALCALLEILVQKDKPLTYIETHAGRGLYDLTLPEAQKTGEIEQGIKRLLREKWFTDNHPYMAALSTYPENVYPGSAALAAKILRQNDVLHLAELHPQEIQYLQASIKDKRAHIYQKDGYENLLALSPPTPRRGLVFIDPSYEIKTEYQDIPDILTKTMRKWPVAVICLWYPILSAGLHEHMKTKLQGLDLPKSGIFETQFNAEKGMRGSGLFLANMPFGTEDAIFKVQDILSKHN